MTGPGAQGGERPRIEPRVTSAVRCVVCHDDLAVPRYTCAGCGVTLHHACRRDVARCPTLGCEVSVALRAAQRPLAPRPAPGAGHDVLYHLVWLVPAAVSAAWPLSFGVLCLATGRTSALLAFLAMTPGFLLGHLLLAPLARWRGDRGSPHLRAALAAACALVLSATLVGLTYWSLMRAFEHF